MGCPSPYWMRRFSASCSVTTLPVADIWAM